MSRGPITKTFISTVPTCHNKMFCTVCDKSVIRLFYTKCRRRTTHTYHVCSECSTVYVRHISGKFISRGYKLEKLSEMISSAMG